MGPELTSRASADAGFSLIELLVVIVVLSVLAVGAVLATGRGTSQTGGAADMARFHDQFTTMQALAIQGRETRGLVVQGKGLRTARPGPEGWKVSETIQLWRGRVAFRGTGEQYEPGAPDIRFLPNGRTSAFSIGFATGGRCESNGWSGLTCDAG